MPMIAIATSNSEGSGEVSITILRCCLFFAAFVESLAILQSYQAFIRIGLHRYMGTLTAVDSTGVKPHRRSRDCSMDLVAVSTSGHR